MKRLLLLLAGCQSMVEAVHPETTPDSATQGNVSLIVSNELGDGDLCTIDARARPGHRYWDLLDRYGYTQSPPKRLPAGQQQEFHVSATAAMAMWIRGCQFYDREPLDLDTTRPTFVHVVGDTPRSGRPAPAPSGYAEQTVTLHYTPPRGHDEPRRGNCLPSGAFVGDRPDGSRCCSGSVGFPNGDSRRATCS